MPIVDVVIVGKAHIPDASAPPSPPGIWGPTDPRPTPPIYLPPQQPPGYPAHPIAGPPEWGHHPAHPIVLPPVTPGEPAHPIVIPPTPPGYPAHPIVLPPETPVGPAHPIYNPVYPSHPIVIPEPPPTEPPSGGAGSGRWIWISEPPLGWVWKPGPGDIQPHA